MDTMQATGRLQHLSRVFLDVESPNQLADLMAEGGCLIASLMKMGLLVFDDYCMDLVETAEKRPQPIWDTSLADFTYKLLFYHVADSYSDRPRNILHTVTQQDTSVTRETRWAEDYREQGQRFSLFCQEIIEKLPKQSGRKAKPSCSERRPRGQWIGPAMAWLKKEPSLNDAEIARKPDVDIHPSQMTRSEEWQAIRRAAAGVARSQLPRGTRYQGELEAIDPDDGLNAIVDD
ncbi:MAG: hypothetical protein NXI32_15165 [bacterium]|nr:hypothetical protein [bacterium]